MNKKQLGDSAAFTHGQMHGKNKLRRTNISQAKQTQGTDTACHARKTTCDPNLICPNVQQDVDMIKAAEPQNRNAAWF